MKRTSEPPTAYFFQPEEGPKRRCVVAGLLFWPFSASTSLNSWAIVSDDHDKSLSAHGGRPS